MSARYFDLIREMKNNTYNHRLRLVESAKERGIKPTARLFSTTVPTVRKWLRRFQQQGPSGLAEHSRARHHQPHKTPPAVEAQLVALRKTLPTFGARRLIREFDLPIGHDALERIWHQHGLIQKRRRKYQRKQDLAHIKARWALFQQISADTKDLDDIPRYWTQAQRLKLPVIQYTARDVRSGLLFWAFAEGRSASASAVFAARIQQHLNRYGVSLRDLVWQTDNGGEFKGDFPKALGQSQHVRIPPAAHTYQSDVETVHRLEEDEFFDLEDFSSRGDFLAKAQTYQLYFNLARPNSHKENQSPWQIIERIAPRSPLELCLLPPVFLDYYLNDSGGYDVPRQPSGLSGSELRQRCGDAEQPGEGADCGKTKCVLTRDEIVGENAPSALRVADAVGARKRVDGNRQLHALVDYLRHERLRQQDAAGTAEGGVAAPVGRVNPILEKHPPRGVFVNHVEPPFEPDEIFPRLVFLASDADHGVGALARAGHGFGARKRRVIHAARCVDGANFELDVVADYGSKRGERFTNGIQFWAARAANGDRDRLHREDSASDSETIFPQFGGAWPQLRLIFQKSGNETRFAEKNGAG